jgi:hypothetical protein
MTEDRATPGVFLLGVGAQKAGTSWLHQQLHSRPDADFGVLKEYHVYDARTVPELMRFRRLDVDIRRPGSWIQPRSWLRQWFIRKPERYVDYFTWLLQRPRLRSGPVRLTGDITPSYALLSAATLAGINAAFAQRGIPVRPVFLMRDPIERLISSQRMKLRKQGRRDAASEVAALRQRARKGRSLRSHYGQTLEALDQSFGLDNCFIGLFETLFRAESHASLCHFLEIPYREPAWEQKVNVSATEHSVPNDVMAELGRSLRPDLEAVERLLPQRDLHIHWSTASRWCR